MRRNAEKDAPIMGRTCPAWLDLSTDGKRYLVNEERAAIVRPSEAASGLGNLQIANRLNRNGIASFRPVIKDQQTKGWHTGTFRRSLSSEAVIGTFTPKRCVDGKRVADEPIENFFPRIIEDSLYWQDREAIITRVRRGAGRKGRGLSQPHQRAWSL